ncbi:Rossmann-fold NAD(P)-binding domain-containing protein [Peribacillus butanolivorans]|uniref:hypothetical protein n=1 Tax=Peribacillus butanolivorans TaxID=421767 RepID=UPI00366BA35E
MLVLSTIFPNEDIQKHMEDTFPALNFIYQEDWEDEPLREAKILITYGEDLTGETNEKAPNFKWVIVLSAGMELMPFKAIEKRGILVVHDWGQS